MFHTFIHPGHQYIIETEGLEKAKTILNKLDSSNQYTLTISSIEPSTPFSEINGYIPTTILYEDGQIEHIQAQVNVKLFTQ